MGTSQVVSSPELSTHLEEDDSNHGRNDENEDIIGSGEANLKNVESAQDMDAGMASGEVSEMEDMEVESP